MKLKKIIFSSLIIAMMTFIFSACGDNAAVNDSAANTANKANTATVVNSDQMTENKNAPASDTKTDSTPSKTDVFTPEKNSPERKAILDALRVPVEKELKQEVSFVSDKFKVQGDWAFVAGKARNAQGGEPNWKLTEYQERIDNGDFDDNLFALLKKNGDKWSVVTYQIGCLDVCYVGWDKEYKAPKAILE